MALAFKQLVGPINTTSPGTSGSFTPVAGDIIAVVGFNGSTGTGTFADTATQGTLAANGTIGNYNDGFGDTWSLWTGALPAAVPTTVTITSAGGVQGLIIDYSGAAPLAQASITETVGSGGTFAGTPVTVAVGSLLVVFVADIDTTSTITAETGSPTLRGSGTGVFGGAYWVYEYAGTGSSFTPSFSNVAADHFVVLQFSLAPGGTVITPALMGQVLT